MPFMGSWHGVSGPHSLVHETAENLCFPQGIEMRMLTSNKPNSKMKTFKSSSKVPDWI